MAVVPGQATWQALQSRTVALDRPLDLLDLAGETGFVWLAGRRGLVTRGVALRLPVGTGPDRLAGVAAAARAALAAVTGDSPGPVAVTAGPPGPVVVGAIPFDGATAGELVVPALVVRQAEDGTGSATITGPAELVEGFDAGMLGARTGRRTAREPWPRITAVRVGQDGAAWRRAVTTVLAAIQAERLGKAVLAREILVQADRPFSRVGTLRRLRQAAAGTYVYARDGFVGATPELLVARHGAQASLRPMAGTVRRGGSPEEQAIREARLAASAKDGREHRFVVDQIVEDLAPLAAAVEVAPVELVRLATVTHLATRITARLADPSPSALDLVARLHPTPAVGGTPREAALALIAELEPFSRGAYAGPVGWMDADGDGEWAVALRCAELDGPRARLLAGAGIVAGSDPATEWAETEAKFAAMLGVLTGS